MIRILICEDKPLIRQGIVKMIRWEELGAQPCQEAGNGFEALDILRASAPDIVITDIRMPGMDALEMVDAMEREGLSAELIVISGYDDFSYVRRMLQHGAVDYLLKPVNPGELNGAICQAIDRATEAARPASDGGYAQMRLACARSVLPEVDPRARTGPVIHYVEANFHRPLRLESLAQMFFLNASYLSAAYRQDAGMTLSDHIRRLRVGFSQALLRNTHLQILEIADLCGYQDALYFCRIFKRQTGQTPSEYRQEAEAGAGAP